MLLLCCSLHVEAVVAAFRKGASKGVARGGLSLVPPCSVPVDPHRLVACARGAPLPCRPHRPPARCGHDVRQDIGMVPE